MGTKRPLYHPRSLHLSIDLQTAINTGAPESCGHLFSLKYRNTLTNPLFNHHRTGALRAAVSKPEARTKPD
jgi:hypothetical protein